MQVFFFKTTCFKFYFSLTRESVVMAKKGYVGLTVFPSRFFDFWRKSFPEEIFLFSRKETATQPYAGNETSRPLLESKGELVKIRLEYRKKEAKATARVTKGSTSCGMGEGPGLGGGRGREARAGLASGKTRGVRWRKWDLPGSRVLPLFGSQRRSSATCFSRGRVSVTRLLQPAARGSPQGSPPACPAGFTAVPGLLGAFPAVQLVERRFHNVP